MIEPSHERVDAERDEESSTLSSFLALLSRRKWAVVASVALGVIAAIALSLRQEKLYKASAEVLLNRENLATSLTGSTNFEAVQDAERFDQTQADVARARAVARQTLDAAGLPNRQTSTFLKHSTVSADLDSDILRFTATDNSRALAIRLTTEYARQFTLYRRNLDTATISGALADVEARLGQLRRAGAGNSDLSRALKAKAQQLRTMETLKTRTATLLNPAEKASQVQPRPIRNAFLGLMLGLVLGLGFAYLRDLLDTRVRSAEEVTDRLRMPLLARVPEPVKELRQAEGLSVLDIPHGPEAESFRMLRTNVDFVNLDRNARMIMVTSALEKEGKSTIVANLALAFARTGKNVLLVDLDLRRPALNRFFRIEGNPGVTDVALGRTNLADALHFIPLTHSAGDVTRRGGDPSAPGTLRVLPSGASPPDPGEFIATNALSGVLRALRDETDLVLIDTPPLLPVGDAMTLSAEVDAVILVVRLNVIRRPILREVRRRLATSPAMKLGFVLTGTEREGGYGYAKYYGPHNRGG